MRALRIAGFVVAGSAAVLTPSAFAGAGWYYAGEIHDAALAVDRTPPKLNIRVKGTEGNVIKLEPAGEGDRWREDGVWGIEWPGGYARAGKISDLAPNAVVRELPIEGELKAGDLVRFDSFAFPHNLTKALGVTPQEVSVAGPQGPLPASFLPGVGDTWLIAVHGRGSSREEAIRLLSGVRELRLPALLTTYRNDAGAPASEDGLYHYGRDEWQDIEAAVAYARDQGARRVVLTGYSMGGAIVLSFMEHSSLAPMVEALILDSPVIDFGAAIDAAGKRKRLPQKMTDLAKSIADRRWKVDWKAVDYTQTTRQLKVPVLLFHGDADTTVPVDASDAFAAARPDIVTYRRVAGATHVRSWNLDPEAYGAAVRSFLGRLGAGD